MDSVSFNEYQLAGKNIFRPSLGTYQITRCQYVHTYYSVPMASALADSTQKMTAIAYEPRLPLRHFVALPCFAVHMEEPSLSSIIYNMTPCLAVQ